MWNKIFKSRSSKSLNPDLKLKRKTDDFGPVSKSAPGSASTEKSGVNNRSKFSKVVNSFTVKRNGKCKKETIPSKIWVNKADDGALRKNNGSRLKGTDFSTYETSLDYADEMEAAPSIAVDLEACPICARTFVPATLEKHVGICEKMAIKKRKTFDSSKQRREGTELAAYLPKKFGLPQKAETKPFQKISTSSPTLLPAQRHEEPRQKSSIIVKRKSQSPVTSTTANLTITEKQNVVVPKKRGLSQQTERCPYCERQFGMKAYDRHVEWCKEKQRLFNSQNNAKMLAAKERLEARTKYRAPCLKTRRQLTKEKYSALGGGESTHSLSDWGGGNSYYAGGGSVCGGSAFGGRSSNFERKMSMSTSMNSSIMSDGGLSDKYDPFLSAKRQLEELCSPTSIFLPDLSPISSSKSIKTKSSNPSQNISTSLYCPNPKVALNSAKSSFRRTSSLRVPRKTTISRPLFSSTPKPMPTVQRGLSDEGPISSNFLKPEEFDEIPVKSACVNDLAISNGPKIIRRDSGANFNRKNNLKLSLNKDINDQSSNASQPLSKTDSLAVFLKYETDANNFTQMPKLTEKDLKDQSNTSLSKQTSLKNSSNDIYSLLSDKEKTDSLKNSLNNIFDSRNVEVSKSLEPKPNKIFPIKLEPLLPKPLLASSFVPTSQTMAAALNLTSFINPKDSASEFIDPKLINVCDNLSLNVTKFSDSDMTTSSPESTDTAKIPTVSQSQSSEISLRSQMSSNQQQSTSNRSSAADKRSLRKRQLRLGVNQFLYDLSPDSDPYSEQCDKTISICCDSMSEKSNQMQETSPTIIVDAPTFDDFDFEKFINSFEDDEQFPIFKDYKEFLSGRSSNKRSNTTNNNFSSSSETESAPFMSPSDYPEIETKESPPENLKSNQEFQYHEIVSPSTISDNPNFNDDDAEVQFGFFENENNDNSQRENKQCGSPKENDSSQNISLKEQKMLQMANDFVHNVKHLDRMCEPSQINNLIDADEISSGECFPSSAIRRSIKPKQSLDSAYGSLSRHSPMDHSRTRQQIPINMMFPTINQQTEKPLQHQPRVHHSNSSDGSSSGSENSLPLLRIQRHQSSESEGRSESAQKMSKFCHECGSRFLVKAKFCMECGVKRIVL